MARQYDVSYENYFDDAGYFAASVFYKDLENYVFDQDQVFDFTGYAYTGPAPALNQGYIKTPTNGNGGYVNGIELSLSLTGQMLTPALEGFGVLLSGSYTDSEVKEGGQNNGKLADTPRHMAHARPAWSGRVLLRPYKAVRLCTGAGQPVNYGFPEPRP